MTRQTISDNQHTFEIVERVPMGYQIWNIGKNMIDGYLPLCRVIPGTFSIEPETLKAIKIDGAQKILAAIGGGQDTIEAMEKYIKRYRNAKPGTWSYRQVKRMKEALPIMRQIKSGAYRNGNLDTVDLLYKYGERPEAHEMDEIGFIPGYAILIIRTDGKREYIRFTAKTNAYMIYHSLKKIAVDDGENIESLSIQKDNVIVERVLY